MAIIRALDPQPLRRHASRWEQLALSRDSTARLTPKHLSTVLQETGRSVGSWHDVFDALIDEDDMLLYDLTTFLALRVYFGVLTRLRKGNLTSDISVGEVFFELSNGERTKDSEDEESFVQIPSSAEDIVDLFPEALPVV